jgi:hypothetical protein
MERFSRPLHNPLTQRKVSLAARSEIQKALIVRP